MKQAERMLPLTKKVFANDFQIDIQMDGQHVETLEPEQLAHPTRTTQSTEHRTHVAPARISMNLITCLVFL